MRHFHLGGISGTLAAGTTGVVLGWRCAASTSKQYIQSVRLSLTPLAFPTADGAIDLRLNLNSGLTANFSGGTDLVPFIAPRILDLQRTGLTNQTPSSDAVTNNIMVSTTSALGGGAGTISSQPWVHGAMMLSDTTAGVSQVAPPLVVQWCNPTQGLEHNDPFQGCLILNQDTGFVAQVTLPAGTTALFSACVDWVE